MRTTLAMLPLLLIAACGLTERPIDAYETENPFTSPEVRRVAVAPFTFREAVPETGYDFDIQVLEGEAGASLCSVAIGQQFAQELAQFPGFVVIPPADVIAAWKAGMREGEDHNPLAGDAGARALGRRLKVDAIVLGEVRSFDPYDYPRLELSWRMLHVGARGAGGDVFELERGGSASRDPGANRGVIYESVDVIDTRNHMTRREVRYYARSLHTELSGFVDGEELIRKQPWPMMFRFGAWLALQKCFYTERNR